MEMSREIFEFVVANGVAESIVVLLRKVARFAA